MNPFVITKKPRVQRRKEMDELDNKVAETKKRSLDKKKKKSKTDSSHEHAPTSNKDDWGIRVYKPPETPIKKLSKMKSTKLKSILAANREELLRLVENDEVDTASAAIYKRMLQALVDVIGHTEAMIHRTKGVRGTHQMNMLVSSIRDILMDLQQAQDRGMLAENLCARFLAPSYLAIGMQVLKENEQLFNRMKRELDKDSIDRYSSYFADQEKRVGEFVQGQFTQVREEVKKFLQR